ncbi:MAG: hypothetical protein ABIU05_14980, partial [Nitrospirales bacterium]
MPCSQTFLSEGLHPFVQPLLHSLSQPAIASPVIPPTLDASAGACDTITMTALASYEHLRSRLHLALGL